MFRFITASRIRTLMAIAALLTTLAIVFMPARFPQRAYRAAKRQWLIMTGGMIDVGGFYLRIECWGQAGPTVVFDSGLNQPRETWGIVPTEVSKFTRVCTYDRAGVGESDRAGFLRTSADVVRELRTLLEKVGETGPFVLVGHSFGGLNVRLFASYYPSEAYGLVLVDPSHEDQYAMTASLLSRDEAEKYLRHESTENNERVNMIASADLVRSAMARQNVPAVLLSAVTGPGEVLPFKTLDSFHTKTIDLYRCGTRTTLSDSSHFIQADRPDAVIDAIKQMVELHEDHCHPLVPVTYP